MDISDHPMFRPPVNRAMRLLDRSFFRTKPMISAAKVFDIKKLSKIRGELTKSKEILNVRQLAPIQSIPVTEGAAQSVDTKCILLQPEVKHDDQKTWSETIHKLLDAGDVSLMPWQLHLDYKHWSYHDIMSSVLPEELVDDIQGAFAHAGHIAQVNLREQYLPYKTMIGEVILDKNPSIRTVINKAETLGSANIYRALEFEVIAGEHDFLVETRETGSTFRFDYSKVFWNSRLSTEHHRLVELFEPGEMVCDVMAGVGPFAVPAGKKGVFVWANDLNPDCYGSLEDAIKLNKVTEYVRPFCEDGHIFIPSSAKLLLDTTHEAKVPKKNISRTAAKAAGLKATDLFDTSPQPKTFDHYVMNLPSTAIDFVPDFVGLYAGHEELFEPYTSTKLPIVHCYCFGPKNDLADDPESKVAKEIICKELSEKIGFEITPEMKDVKIFDVRDVAPKKRQYCASFRLPPEVAFRTQ